MLRAVVFDFDGTLADTETVEFECWSRAFERHGARLEREEWMQCVGAGPEGWDPLDALCRRAPKPVDGAQVLEAVHCHRSELLASLAPRPGVVGLLDSCAEAGVALGVASSSPYGWVHGLLRQTGLADRFAAVATRDDVLRAKPAPELFELALRRLGAHPGEAVAVEDSPNGVTAALAAGLAAVVVPNAVTSGSSFPLPHVRFESFEGLSALALAEAAGARARWPARP